MRKKQQREDKNSLILIKLKRKAPLRAVLGRQAMAQNELWKLFTKFNDFKLL